MLNTLHDNMLMNEKVLLRWLVAVVSVIILLNIISVTIGIPSWQITRLIAVGEESNFPTWFSSLLLAIAGVFAYKCALASNNERGNQIMWKLLSVVFWGMSCEEVAMVHEHIELGLNEHFAFKYNWTAILGPFILLIVAVFIFKMKRCLKNSPKAARILALGVFIYIGGAIFLESTLNFLDPSHFQWFFKIENIAEESFEMFGVILIIKGLIMHHKHLLG